MEYRLAADAVVLLHGAFILFVVLGGLLALRWRWVAAVHLPAALWGVLVQAAGWMCPLTPLEVELRIAADGAGYEGGFVEHYLIPAIYPAELTRCVQYFLAGLVLAVNFAVYRVWLNRVVKAGKVAPEGRSGLGKV